jgi:hypothetical protein
VDGPTVASDRPERTSLYVSVPSFLLRSVLPLAIFLVFFIGRGDSFPVVWLVLVVAVGLVSGLFWWLFYGIRRVDLDGEGITYIPLLSLRRTQSFKWSEIGNFEVKTFGSHIHSPTARSLQAPIWEGRSSRVMSLLPRSTLILPTLFARRPGAAAMSANELLSLVNSYRS